MTSNRLVLNASDYRVQIPTRREGRNTTDLSSEKEGPFRCFIGTSVQSKVCSLAYRRMEEAHQRLGSAYSSDVAVTVTVRPSQEWGHAYRGAEQERQSVSFDEKL